MSESREPLVSDGLAKTAWRWGKSKTPGDDAPSGKWAQQIPAAEIAWSKLTHDELVGTDGRIQKLADLVQERYALSRDEAEQGVMRFFDKQASTS